MNDLFVRRRGVVDGPFSVEEIKAQIARGEIVPLHELSPDGLEWTRAGKIWEEFVPKPNSMIEMAERKPIPLKPAVQPADVHKSSPNRSAHGRSSRSRSTPNPSRSGQSPRSGETARPTPKPEQGPPPRNSEADSADTSDRPTVEPMPSPPRRTPLTINTRDEVLDDLVEWSEDDVDRDRLPRPEPMMGAYRLRLLAIATGFVAVLAIIVSLVGLWLDLTILQNIFPVPTPWIHRIRPMYDFAAGVRICVLALKAFFLVLFLSWVYFSATYLYAKSHGRMKIMPLWCVAWFLIPIANLWKPYRVVRELQRRSEQYLRFDDPAIIREPIVGIWWCLWVFEIAAIGYHIYVRFTTDWTSIAEIFPSDPELHDLKREIYRFMYSDMAALAAGIFAAIATLVLLQRLQRVRPKWETRSRRRNPY